MAAACPSLPKISRARPPIWTGAPRSARSAVVLERSDPVVECLLTPVKTLHVPILMVISPFYDHSFPFIVDNTQVVAVVSIPSGIVSSLRMVLQFAPVAKSVLQATVRHYRLNYTVEQLFISSAFALSLHRFAEITRVSPFPAIDRVFSVPITVEFRNIRSPLFSTEDWCVGQLTTSGWQCASDIQHQPNGRWFRRAMVSRRLVAAIPARACTACCIVSPWRRRRE